MASTGGRANIRTQPLYLPNNADPRQFNVPEAEWRFPGMIGGSGTFPFGAGTAADPNVSKTVQLVRTDSTMTVNPYDGAAAWWVDRPNYKVTTAATNRGAIAGVFLGPVVKGRLACIQTGGLHPKVKFIDAVTSAPDATGKIVVPSATAGKFDCLGAGTAATYPAVGVSAGAYNGADATAPVMLAIPQVT